ncbi:MAG: hypothetical protein AAF660_10960 [Pseudomonadota bacterium]
MFSIADDGQFYSTEYVTSYYTDPDTDELVLFFAAYEDIQDIDVIWSQSFMEDTIATVTSDDGSQFEVWLSAEQDGDRQFVDGMTAIWRDKRPADP